MLSVHEFSEIWIIDHSTTTPKRPGTRAVAAARAAICSFAGATRSPIGAVSEQTAARAAPFAMDTSRFQAAGMCSFSTTATAGPMGNTRRSMKSCCRWTQRNTSGRGRQIWPRSGRVELYRAEKDGFYSNFISGATRLPNGNTLICSGANGTLFEVTPERKARLEFMNPWRDERTAPGGGRARGTAPAGRGGRGGAGPNGRSIFRVYRFAPDSPALVGKTLTPGPTLVELLLAITQKLYRQVREPLANSLGRSRTNTSTSGGPELPLPDPACALACSRGS